MAAWQLPAELAAWIVALAQPLDARLAWRLAPIMVGALFAQGRQTVASWLRAAEVGHDFRAHYYFLGSLGRKTKLVASVLLKLVVARLAGGERLLFGIDDSPTKRYGPCVEGAGLHHNPTPGPADQKFLYGHVWVTIALLMRHPLWGTIGLPLLSMLYVRQRHVAELAPWYKIPFQTKLEMAAQLTEWIADRLKFLGLPLWIVVDGAYAKRTLLKRALAAGVTVVSRLRKDAALRSLPDPNEPGRRGRRRKYGTRPISLAKRAGQKRGWETGQFLLYGQTVTKTFKTFLATYQPAYGLIRVVLVKEGTGWIALFCTDPTASVSQILEAFADRFTIEQVFHDVKEVHGVGKQQLRNYWANLGAFNLILWLHTLIELWSWNRTHRQLCDRRRSPWDAADRRPSHADRRGAVRRQCIAEEIKLATVCRPITRQIKTLVQRLFSLAI